MGYPIFIISLDRCANRFDFVASQLNQQGLDFERVPAVDASDFDRAFMRKYRRRSGYYQSLSPGEIACHLSHRKCWQLIVERGLSAAVVLEDDVRLDPNFSSAIQSAEGLSKNWDYLKLHGSRRGWVETVRADNGFSIVKFSRVPGYTFAQIVNREAAEALLAMNLPKARPIDVDLKWHWEIPGVRIRNLYPEIVFDESDNLGGSVIAQQGRKEKGDFRLRVSKVAYNLNFAWRNLGQNIKDFGLIDAIKLERGELRLDQSLRSSRSLVRSSREISMRQIQDTA